jgi:hypothetical protein
LISSCEELAFTGEWQINGRESKGLMKVEMDFENG